VAIEATHHRTSDDDWYDEAADAEEEEYPIDQYDITASPNDFNVLTIFSFIESGAVRFPGFQRNYVWDIKRASKLIESLIIGLPVPQIFLYEESRNRFLVIDGQQRLMSIYYFMKQRFPRPEKRTELRRLTTSQGMLPVSILENDAYFTRFSLKLPEILPTQPNRFDGLNYSTLGEYKTAFELRTIRNVIVKQVSPEDDDSSIYELFNRLNSGGVNLTAQEIRMSLYHSAFYEMLAKANTKAEWRRLLGIPEPDLHMKDIEFLLHGFAMLEDGANYLSPMIKFLNGYSKKTKTYDATRVSHLEELFVSFLASCTDLPDNAFFRAANRFSVSVFEAVFAAVCGPPHVRSSLVVGRIDADSVARLKVDAQFVAASARRTADKGQVSSRLAQAREIVVVR
jgi:uncharacterized protein with ParB-like and HNH nuclease domain